MKPGRLVAVVVVALAAIAFPVLVLAALACWVLVTRGGKYAAAAVFLVVVAATLALGGPAAVLSALHLAHTTGQARPDTGHVPAQVTLGAAAGLAGSLLKGK